MKGFRSISVLLALELLPTHNSVFHIQGLYCTNLPFFSEFFSSDLLVKVLFAFRVIWKGESYELLWSKVHFTTCFLWFVEIINIYVISLYFPSFYLVYVFILSLFLSQFVDCLPPFCPSVSLFYFFIPASLPQGTHSESYVMCTFQFSFTERYSIYQFATKAWGEITWKKWIICFLWMLYTLKKSYFSFTAVDNLTSQSYNGKHVFSLYRQRVLDPIAFSFLILIWSSLMLW